MAAANRTPDLELRAAFLAHAVDERRHADAYAARAVALDASLASHPDLYRASVEHRYARLGEDRFIALLHRGERRSCDQLRRYCAALRRRTGTKRADPDTLALCETVLRDEVRHEHDTRALMRARGTGRAGAVVWELLRTWRRAGTAVTERLFHGLMMAMYLLLGPIALLEQWRARAD